jgi:hypothetical protein
MQGDTMAESLFVLATSQAPYDKIIWLITKKSDRTTQITAAL